MDIFKGLPAIPYEFNEELHPVEVGLRLDCDFETAAVLLYSAIQISLSSLEGLFYVGAGAPTSVRVILTPKYIVVLGLPPISFWAPEDWRRWVAFEEYCQANLTNLFSWGTLYPYLRGLLNYDKYKLRYKGNTG